MRITTRAVFDIETMELLEWSGEDYEGPMEHAGGGPSPEQKAAAASQATLSGTENSAMMQAIKDQKAAHDQAFPFYQGRMQGGLPFFNALSDYNSAQNAQAYAPARAAIYRSTSQYNNLPSGYRDSLLANLGAAQGRAFDNNMSQNLMLNEQTKSNAASGITGQQQLANPLGWAGAQGSANSSIMNAPLSTPGLMGVLGGLGQAAIGAIPK